MTRILLTAGLLLTACAPTQAAERPLSSFTAPALLTETARAIATLPSATQVEPPAYCAVAATSAKEANILAGRSYGNFAYTVSTKPLDTIEALTAATAANPNLTVSKWQLWAGGPSYSSGAFFRTGSSVYSTIATYHVSLDLRPLDSGGSVICGHLIYL